MQNKTKEKLREKLASLKNEILSQTPDNAKNKKLMDEILSVQSQLDVEPTLVHIPTSEILKEYDNGSIVIYRCKNCIVWHVRGGETKVIYPTMTGEYQFLQQMLDMKDEYDTLDKELKDAYDAYYLGYSVVNAIPSIAASSDKYFVEAAKWSMDFTSTLYDELMNTPIQEETSEENARHEAVTKAVKEVMKDGKD